MIVGTAGHVDHGKTSLVRSLTGVDTDRLREEKARGITIELGFAYLPVPGGTPIGFVDVPGHERLVRTMVAGAAAIDFVLLVIAADDGVMPQTREHAAILDLLGLRRGLVVVAKSDRVSQDRIAYVRAGIADALAGSPFAEAEMLDVSTLTGQGVDALRDRLIREALAPPPRNSSGLFRMPVDRTFTLPGVGTIVTGTALRGRIAVGDDVVVLPSHRRARIRSLHAQSSQADFGEAGERLALALAGPGIGREIVGRGSWLCAPHGQDTTVRFDAEVRLLSSEVRAVRDNTPVHFHCGASDALARLFPLAGSALAPGHEAFVQIVLERPLPLRQGDRFVLRDQSATRTIGGGRVIDPRAPARRRRTPERLAILEASRPADASEAIRRLLALSPGLLETEVFGADRGMTSEEMAALLATHDLSVVQSPSGRHAGRPGRWAELGDAATAALRAFHAENPDLLGLAVEHLRTRLGLSRPVFETLSEWLVAEKRIVATGHWRRLPDHIVTLGAEDMRIAALAVPHIAADRFRPPRVRDIAREEGIEEAVVRRTMKALARTGDVVEIARDHFFTRAAVAEIAEIAEELTRGGEGGHFTAADLRDRLDNGRKVAIQILDYFDRQGLTRRDGDLRRVVKAPLAVFGPVSAPP